MEARGHLLGDGGGEGGVDGDPATDLMRGSTAFVVRTCDESRLHVQPVARRMAMAAQLRAVSRCSAKCVAGTRVSLAP